MNQLNKTNIPLKGATQKIHISSHSRILHIGNVVKDRKSYLETSLAASHIVQESNLQVVSGNKSSMTRKETPAPSNILLEAHPIRPWGVDRTPPAPAATIFGIHNGFPPSLTIIRVTPQLFP